MAVVAFARGDALGLAEAINEVVKMEMERWKVKLESEIDEMLHKHHLM